MTEHAPSAVTPAHIGSHPRREREYTPHTGNDHSIA
jgi:hypothetical protein